MCEERKFSELLHKMIAAGVGFISISEEKARTFIEELVKRGELSAKEGEGLLKSILERLESTGKDIETRVSEMVKKYLKRENVYTKDDIDKLAQRIEQMEKRMDDLEGKTKSER